MPTGVFDVLPARPLTAADRRTVADRSPDHLRLVPISTVRADDGERIAVVLWLDTRRRIAYALGYHPGAAGWALIDIWAEDEYSAARARVAVRAWGDRCYGDGALELAVPETLD